MLKKIIIGFLCFVILAVTGAGVYLYTLDWNKHKALVAQRLSQITGLNALIDGNLTVELFPTPKFSAGRVKFFKQGNSREPLVVVNEIAADVELMPLIDNKFIIKSMKLTNATVDVKVSENGELNWSGAAVASKNKSGNVEVSFNDIRLTGSTLNYVNSQTGDEFSLPNVTASVSAPSLRGPYKTNGSFIRNNSEFKFNGSIVKDDVVSTNFTVENLSTSSKVNIEGTLGATAKGAVTFETQNLNDVVTIFSGDNTLGEVYGLPLYFSFKYDYENKIAKFGNFTVKYGKDTTGNGSITLNNKEIAANFDMKQFDLGIIENITNDFVSFVRSGKKFADTDIAKYNVTLSLKAAQALFKNAPAKNFSLGLNLKDGVLDLTRLGVILPGETAIKTVGKISLNDNLRYQFNQVADSGDLRSFASVLGIDLAKLADANNKKNIFKRAQAEVKYSGDLNSVRVAILSAMIDSITFTGNLGFVKKGDETFALADVKASQILFDKYVQAVPQNLSEAPLKDKFIYQLNLIPWDRDVTVDADITLESAVYNSIPLEKVMLSFSSNKDNLNVKKFSAENIGGASINLSFDAQKVYTSPYFKELSYDIKTSNFPMFATTFGIRTNDKPLFKRKIFASQGALSGSFDNFSLSSVQKFGDSEFSYTGSVTNTKKNVTIDGDLELKTKNFSQFVKALGLNYSPNIPVTTFTLSGKINGSSDAFSLRDINSYLGANGITGNFTLDRGKNTPKLTAELDFNKFDADCLLEFNHPFTSLPKDDVKHTFIKKLEFNDDRFDFSALKGINFDVSAKAKQLVYKNKIYADTAIKTTLNDGVLKVSSFKTSRESCIINSQFDLDSNNIPKINGSYSIKDMSTPELGGTLYALEPGFFDSEGTFSSLAVSPKQFVDNLNARGKFQFHKTAMKGWDLDLIKFELEQRKSVDGFEDSVLNSLKSGRSMFSDISGKYDMTKGNIVVESAIWESPVANLSMNLGFNLSDWNFNASFNTIYLNASFSDVLKFSASGNLANPVIKTDLSESIKRIGETEHLITTVQSKRQKELNAKLINKRDVLVQNIDLELTDIARITLDVVRFEPLTKNENVVKIYNTNVQMLNSAEKVLKSMKEGLKVLPSEETLADMESRFNIEKSKLQFIPKTLEDNFIVDSKYIFDDTFNKIAWLYNVAQNNSSYYNSLTEAYMYQVSIMDESDTPVSEDKKEQFERDIKAVNDDMEKISSLHNKIRDNYLNIIDSAKIAEMKKNNEIAAHALQTILTYIHKLDEKIVGSIDTFRAALSINAKDYDEYLIYPPQDVKDIDLTQPSTRAEGSAKEQVLSAKRKESATVKNGKSDETGTDEKSTLSEKKKQTGLLNLDGIKSGISNLINQFETKKDTDDEIRFVSGTESGGLSGLLKEYHNEKTTLSGVVSLATEDVFTSSGGLKTAVNRTLSDSKDDTKLSTTADDGFSYVVSEMPSDALSFKKNQEILGLEEGKTVMESGDADYQTDKTVATKTDDSMTLIADAFNPNLQTVIPVVFEKNEEEILSKDTPSKVDTTENSETNKGNDDISNDKQIVLALKSDQDVLPPPFENDKIEAETRHDTEITTISSTEPDKTKKSVEKISSDKDVVLALKSDQDVLPPPFENDKIESETRHGTEITTISSTEPDKTKKGVEKISSDKDVVLALKSEKNVLPLLSEDSKTEGKVLNIEHNMAGVADEKNNVSSKPELEVLANSEGVTEKSSDLLENTKLVMNEIMVKIKNAEDNFKALFTESEENKKTEALNENKQLFGTGKKLTGSFFGKTDTHSGTLKMNPVVALDIGKETILPEQQNDIRSSLGRKTSFLKKDTTAVTALSNKGITVNIAENISAKSNDAIGNTLLNLITDNRNEIRSNFSPNLKSISDDAPVYIENAGQPTDKSKNKYVFADSGAFSGKANGVIGKKALADRHFPLKDRQEENKYVFAANRTPLRSVEGIIGKRTSLYVK